MPFEGLKAAFQGLKSGLSKFKGTDLKVYRRRLKGTPFQRIWAAQGPKRGLAVAKLEALFKFEGGPLARRKRLQANPRKSAAGPLFEGLRPLEGQKGVQQWQKEESAAGPLFKGSRPLRGQKEVQQWQKEGVCKPILGNLLLDPFLKDLGRSGAKKGSSS